VLQGDNKFKIRRRWCSLKSVDGIKGPKIIFLVFFSVDFFVVVVGFVLLLEVVDGVSEDAHVSLEDVCKLKDLVLRVKNLDVLSVRIVAD
jgi:hypothetical protein